MKAVIVELDQLVSHIRADYETQTNVDEPWSINMFTTSTDGLGTSTTGVNGHFIYSQVLLDCLLRMKSGRSDIDELISCCLTEYGGNTCESDYIREFEKEYSPSKPLWWYTRNSFFYKTLNAALRTQNIHLIFLFRSFIADIHHQLQQCQAQQPMRAYRGQLMLSDELNILQELVGQFISVNSFFSASTDCSAATSFLNHSPSRYLERVLFQIDADPTTIKSKPFADISAHSEFGYETEILSMFGSIFRIVSIDLSDDQSWIVRMELCSDDEHDFKDVLWHLKNQHGNGETNLRILGKIVWKIGAFPLAEEYYCRFLERLLPNDPLLGTLYEYLAEITSQQSGFDQSMQWQQKSLQFHQQQQQQTPTISRPTGEFPLKSIR